MIVDQIELTEGRREQIIRLLGILDDHLPEPSRRDASTSGFVNEQRSRTCPDCLANGRTMFGCETCGGSGTVVPSRIGSIAAPDELDTDGERMDPYAQHSWLDSPYGVAQTGKVGYVHERDAEIERLDAQLREPFKSAADEIAEANQRPYVWERERRALRRRYDIDATMRALDALRISAEPGLASLVLSVYGHRLDGIPAFIEASATLEEGLERALRFLSDQLPAELRAPGGEEHPAIARQRRRDAA